MVSDQPTATFVSVRALENHAVHQLFRDGCMLAPCLVALSSLLMFKGTVSLSPS